jgi:GntR family transcriptional regulator / MocR family aminotransferase
MSKTPRNTALPLGARSNGATLFRWLYDEIRTAIVDGRLQPGSRLPSTRSVSSQYGVARGTVVAAFDQLAAEGYVESTVGNGTFVRRGGNGVGPPQVRGSNQRLALTPPKPSLSAGGRRLAGNPFPSLVSNRTVETFRLDRPALDAFPIRLWSRIAARRLRSSTTRLLTHGEVLGFRPLREAIATHVGLTRGVKCTADQVVVTTGTQQSLDLVARLVLDPGDRVWMEDPGYSAATALFRASGAEVIGVPVDAEGMDCDVGRRRGQSAKLAYVTPGCQFPLSVGMSLPRRLALLQWAHEVGAWVFEDDYDSQLRFSGRPLAALQSLDTAGCVIYSNTFNKMLFPGLRLGFLVVPPTLVDAVTAARSVTERFPSVPDQATLSDFISEGHLDQHMRRMGDLYTARFEALIHSARRTLKDLMEVSPAGAGLQVVGWLATNLDEHEVCRRAAERGIDSVPLSKLMIDRSMSAGLVLGMASADVRAIRRAIQRLGEVLRELQSRSGIAK